MTETTRRELLRIAGVAGLAGFAGCSSSDDGQSAGDDTPTDADSGRDDTPRATGTETGSTTQGDGWPMMGADPANTGHTPEETGPTDGVTTSWVFETGGAIHSAPAVVGGTVYVGNWDSSLYAIAER